MGMVDRKICDLPENVMMFLPWLVFDHVQVVGDDPYASPNSEWGFESEVREFQKRLIKELNSWMFG